jgi:hypothetical protein
MQVSASTSDTACLQWIGMIMLETHILHNELRFFLWSAAQHACKHPAAACRAFATKNWS